MKTKLILSILISFLLACGSNVSEEDSRTQLEIEHELFKVSYADSVNSGLLEDTFKGSARREAKAKIGDTDIIVNYGSPGVRGRVIWNGLVSYDQVWVSGSHWATAVSFSNDVNVNGINVPAGMYSIFTIPGRSEWTMILNKEFDMHLADDYEESEDIVRVRAQPQELETPVQRLTYEIVKTGEDSGEIQLSWDQIKVSLPFNVK